MKFTTVVLLLSVLFSRAEVSYGVLIDRGTGMIYDSQQNITWLEDANYAQTSGYSPTGWVLWYEASAWADELEYEGLEDWRLPTTPGTGEDIFEGEMGSLYANEGINVDSQGPFNNVQNSFYWSGTDSSGDGSGGDVGSAWTFPFREQDAFQSYATKDNEALAWAVRDEDYGPSVATGESFVSEYMTLGEYVTFDLWLETTTEPSELELNILFFDGSKWETLNVENTFTGSSTNWQSISIWLPPFAQGEYSQIMFNLVSLQQGDSLAVLYLNSIATTATGVPAILVPEPSVLLLIFSMIVAFVGVRGCKREE